MESSGQFFTAFVVGLIGATATASHVDFSDPRRALGREGNVRIDAQLTQDTLSANSVVTVTYQIENLTSSTIAVADKIVDTDFDPDSRTITLAIGAEIPPGPNMPHLVMIKSGEKRTLNAGALVHVTLTDIRTPWTAVPRYVQVKVTVLKDVMAFASLIEKQNRNTMPIALPDSMFERWVEGSESVLLNSVPVYWRGESRRGTAESSQPAGTD